MKQSVSDRFYHFFNNMTVKSHRKWNIPDSQISSRYGIHSEDCPTPVFILKKDQSEKYPIDQLAGDTHDYAEGEILYNIPCDLKVWDVVKIDGKSSGIFLRYVK